MRVYALADGLAPSRKYTLADAADNVFPVAFSADSKPLARGPDAHEVRVYYGLAGGVAPSLKNTLDDTA